MFMWATSHGVVIARTITTPASPIFSKRESQIKLRLLHGLIDCSNIAALINRILVFITGTAAEVTAIGKIDDVEYKVGPVTRALREAYEALVRGKPVPQAKVA